jgi:hypothetical protein
VRRARRDRTSIIGHITPDELRRHLEVTEAANGFGNGFLWVLAKRSKELPHGGARVQLDASARILERGVDAGRRAPELRREPAANAYWEKVYSGCRRRGRACSAP